MTHTTAIVIITCLVTLFAWQNRRLQERLIFYPPAINQGQIDRFITHGFIHADWMHLLFNMFTLYSFGRAIERLYIDKFGSLGFLSFYCLAIVVAIIPSYLSNKTNPRYLSLGASGGVSAVIFAFILLSPWSMLYFFGIVPIPAIVFAVLYVGYGIYAQKRGTGNINHMAHLVGAAFGVVATLLLYPNLLGHFFYELLKPLGKL